MLVSGSFFLCLVFFRWSSQGVNSDNLRHPYQISRPKIFSIPKTIAQKTIGNRIHFFAQMTTQESKNVLKNLLFYLDAETPEDLSMTRILDQKLLEIELRPEENVQLNAPLLSEDDEIHPFRSDSKEMAQEKLKQNISNCLKALAATPTKPQGM